MGSTAKYGHMVMDWLMRMVTILPARVGKDGRGVVGGCGGLWVAPFFCRRTENVLQASQVYIFEDIWPSGQIKRFWPSMQCTTLDVH